MSKTFEKHRDVSPEWLKPLMEICRLLGDSLAETITERMAGLLPDFEAQRKQTAYALEDIQKRLDASIAHCELLDNANRTNRLLGDQFYDERIIQPMIRGLFPMADLLHQAMGRPGCDHAHLLTLRTQLDQFLTLYGVQAFHHEANSDFDPRIMKPLQTVASHEPDLDGLVAESLQCGFRTSQRILRLETVSLYKFETQPTTPTVANDERSNHDNTGN